MTSGWDESTGSILRDLIAERPRGTQAALARRLGVRPQTITKWLSDEVALPIIRWLPVERALDAEPLTFARRTGLLRHLPDFASVPLDELDEVWRRSWSVGRERREQEAEDLELARREAERVIENLRAVALGNPLAKATEQALAGARLGLLWGLWFQVRVDRRVLESGLESDNVAFLRLLAKSLKVTIPSTLTLDQVILLQRDIAKEVEEIESRVDFLKARREGHPDATGAIIDTQFAIAAEGAEERPNTEPPRPASRPRPSPEQGEHLDS